MRLGPELYESAPAADTGTSRGVGARRGSPRRRVIPPLVQFESADRARESDGRSVRIDRFRHVAGRGSSSAASGRLAERARAVHDRRPTPFGGRDLVVPDGDLPGRPPYDGIDIGWPPLPRGQSTQLEGSPRLGTRSHTSRRGGGNSCRDPATRLPSL